MQTSDKIGDDTIPFTREFLGKMLGVQRGTIAVTAAKFEAAGLIHTRRGRIELLNKKALRKHACTCYDYMQRHIDRWCQRSVRKTSGNDAAPTRATAPAQPLIEAHASAASQSAVRVRFGAVRASGRRWKSFSPAFCQRGDEHAAHRRSSVSPADRVRRSPQPAKTERGRPDRVVTVAVTVDGHRPPPPNRPRAPYNIDTSDDTNTLTITYFNTRRDYLEKLFPKARPATSPASPRSMTAICRWCIPTAWSMRPVLPSCR